MTSDSYGDAERRLSTALQDYRRAVDMARRDPVRASEPWYLPGASQSVVAAVVDVWTSADGVLDDPRGLTGRALALLRTWHVDLRDDPRVVPEMASAVEMTARWVERTQQRSAEIISLAITTKAWEERTPSLAPLGLRRDAIAAIELALAIPLTGRFPVRMALAAVRALGPRLAVGLAQHYIAQRFDDYACWQLVEVTLDELAAWASATELHGTPQAYQDRAVPALISIAGHPDLTESAMRRIPVHRLTAVDRRRVADLLADREAVMPFDWISDENQLGTTSVEVMYLRALDAEAHLWPGQRAR